MHIYRVWGGRRSAVCRPGSLHAQHVCIKLLDPNRSCAGRETGPLWGWGGSGGKLRGVRSIFFVSRRKLWCSCNTRGDWSWGRRQIIHLLPAFRWTESNWWLLDLRVLSVFLQRGHSPGAGQMIGWCSAEVINHSIKFRGFVCFPWCPFICRRSWTESRGQWCRCLEETLSNTTSRVTPIYMVSWHHETFGQC